jgi:hypothetical protein
MSGIRMLMHVLANESRKARKFWQKIDRVAAGFFTQIISPGGIGWEQQPRAGNWQSGP